MNGDSYFLDIASRSIPAIDTVNKFVTMFAYLTPAAAEILWNRYGAPLGVSEIDFLMTLDLIANYEKRLDLHFIRWDLAETTWRNIVFETLSLLSHDFAEVLVLSVDASPRLL